MRGRLLLLIAACGTEASTPQASAQDCADADPYGVIAHVHGNFEFVVDPNDPLQHLIYVNHVTNGPSSIVRHGNQKGSYVIPVSASGSTLQVGQAQQIATAANGSEIEYLPAAGKFAIFYQTSRFPTQLTRCFLQP